MSIQEALLAEFEAELKRRALDETRSFDHALREAIRSQARAKGFVFEDERTSDDVGAARS